VTDNKPKNPIEVFKGTMELKREDYQSLLPKHVTFDRFMRTAVTAVARDPSLLQADKASLFFAVREAASCGLEISGINGEGYLVVRNDRKRNTRVVQFMPGYKGLIKLARQSNEISTIDAGVLYQNDEIEYQRGTDPKFTVVPNWKDPGDPIGAFAVAVFKDGTYQCKVMSVREIEEIRKRGGGGGKFGPWVTDWGAMATKTAIKQLCKLLPMSLTDERMSKAMDVDDVAEEEDVQALSAPKHRERKAASSQPLIEHTPAADADEDAGNDDNSTSSDPLDDLASANTSEALDGDILLPEDDGGQYDEEENEEDEEDPTAGL
jgi:recombination protein RecT